MKVLVDEDRLEDYDATALNPRSRLGNRIKNCRQGVLNDRLPAVAISQDGSHDRTPVFLAQRDSRALSLIQVRGAMQKWSTWDRSACLRGGASYVSQPSLLRVRALDSGCGENDRGWVCPRPQTGGLSKDAGKDG